MIVFSQLEFIFRFLPIFLIIYHLTPLRWKNAVLFIGSILVYAEADWKSAVLLLVLVAINAGVGQLLYAEEEREEEGRRRRLILAAIVVLDVAVLAVCKALALTREGFYLPLGLSFYIFKMISFQADLYRGKMRHRPTLVKTAAYFTMFPQITQGPIMRYTEGGFDRERDRRTSFTSFENGLVFFVTGLSFKLLLADRLGILWNEIAKIGYESISTPLAWMGAFGYSFQLYFDFWGYSLMAAGVAMMLGFSFLTNFRHPYAARGIAEFYRTWHMTLGSWFRDYVYIPLGGSRKGKGRTVLNLFAVWLLTGLWHGGTLNFVIWGMVLFLLIVWEKMVAYRWAQRLPLLGHLRVWFFIPLTWVIFAIPNLEDLRMYFTRLFPFFGTGVAVNAGDFLQYAPLYAPYFVVAFLLSAIPQIFTGFVGARKTVPVVLALTALFWICIYAAVTATGNTFMYFTF